jgi:cell wall-associated NlpC family hydrolase
MAGNAASLLQALGGKGLNSGGYNPFGGGASSNSTPNAATSTNPAYAGVGTDLQNQVQQSQNQYQSQQDASRAQLMAGIQSASIGPGSAGISQNPTGNNGVQSNDASSSSPFAQFNDAIGGITQRGLDATGQVQNAANQAWQQKLSGLNNQYQQNLSTPQSWSETQIGAMLGNVQGQLPAGADPNSPGSRAIQLAKQSLGVPYVWGGNSLTQGVDCSGLVQQVYGKLGIQLPRTSTEQAKTGKIVPSLSQAMPGDLILEYSPYEPAGLQQFGHVGIYIGNGQVIEAPGTGKNVRIGPIVNMTRIVRPW